MKCPFAVWKPVPNYSGNMTTHVGVVIHVTAGESDPWPWFDENQSQASSHFFIGNGQGGVADGALEQYVDTDLTAWAEMAGNSSYISVETEGQPTDPLTTAQVATFAKLYAWVVGQYPYIPFAVVDTPGQAGFITHGDGGAAWGGHTNCPGNLRSAQRSAILALAKPAPQPQPQPTKETLDVPQPIVEENYDGAGGVRTWWRRESDLHFMETDIVKGGVATTYDHTADHPGGTPVVTFVRVGPAEFWGTTPDGHMFQLVADHANGSVWNTYLKA